MAPSITSIPAITLQAITPRLADNILLGNNTIAFLMSKGKVRLVDGADFLQKPIIWTLNTNAQSYTGFDPLSITNTDEFTAATFNWKQYSVSASRSGLDEMRNANPNGVIKQWAAKLEHAENSLKQLMDTHIHADMTTKAATDILGFDEFMEDTAVPGATIGGINRGTEAWWRNKYTAGTVATITPDFRKAGNKAKEGRTAPDFGISCLPFFEAVVDANAGKQRLINDAMMKINYENVMIDGITLMWNRNCKGEGVTTPSAATPWNCYLGNSEFLALEIHRDRNFVSKTPRVPISQDAEVAFILWGGAMTLSNSRFQSVLQITG